MTETDFYQQLLDLDRLIVNHVAHHTDHILIYATLEAQPTPCPLCLRPTTTVNQYTQRQLQDLSISGKAVRLDVRMPQYSCHRCTRYFTDEPDWIMPGESHTRRQAKWIFDLCAKQPFTEVAALVGRSHKTVERLYCAFAQEQINLTERYARVRRLGIDEVAHRKGKRDYVCVLTDLDRGVQLDVLRDRKKATLMAHFEALGCDFADQIRSRWSAATCGGRMRR
ncbi:MAG: transposase family protein [Bacteroidota bacterium]